LRKFLAGEPDDVPWMQDWLSMVRVATAQGRCLGRVRVVSVPLSEYNRFSYALARHNIAAGEDIRYMSRDTAQTVGLPSHDYWLFDSRTLALMHFDDDDRFTGAQVIEAAAAIVQHNYWRDAAWHHATRRDDFAIE
jgi:Family of unknown function (DUF6879)